MKDEIIKISGKLVDIHKRKIYPASIYLSGEIIREIREESNAPDKFILPGFVDAHIHIESSMVTPGAFAGAAVKQGTTAVVSDPHEIANVLGKEGVDYMINDSEKVPLKFYFGAPSCVPATSFETSGAEINVEDIDIMLGNPDIRFLSEMMNFPGVIFNDGSVLKKIDSAKKHGKKIDGHAPGLRGEMLKKYVSAGITTDHECSTLEEAREKLSLGMKILIREGSAARNLDSLKELVRTNPEDVMLCSDDLHPEMLRERHINKLVSSLISEGFDPYNVIRCATINPAMHYGLDCGLLRPGDKADLIVVDSLESMNVSETWIDGKKVFENGRVVFDYIPGKKVNRFVCSAISAEDIKVKKLPGKIRVIEAVEGELITGTYLWDPGNIDVITADVESDILKIVVKDRYKDFPAAVGFIRGFGLKKGAFASSVAHDSHNIICVGASDEDIVEAINAVIKMKGGLSAVSGNLKKTLTLDIAGIMSTRSVDEIAAAYQDLSETVMSFGTLMKAPFMTLSFMALLVIPELKIGDKGLFDVKEFRLVSLFI
ncbi:MAG TPA: adenine deaminase [Bacteroidales bacterium]|nr:adenine deaminase [Bacteroidales bacterium]